MLHNQLRRGASEGSEACYDFLKFYVMVSHGIDFGGMSHLKAGVVIV